MVMMSRAITFLFASCLIFSLQNSDATSVDVADFVNQWHNMFDSLMEKALLPISPSRCLETNNVNLTTEEWNMLHGIMTNLFRSSRGKRSNVQSGKEIAKIWNDDRSICFAGRKLPFQVPDGAHNMEVLREAINTFIVLLSHIRGEFFRLM
eukprot:09264.XXX_20554_19041_1 [CDS] Oithona nana genome sequencing.